MGARNFYQRRNNIRKTWRFYNRGLKTNAEHVATSGISVLATVAKEDDAAPRKSTLIWVFVGNTLRIDNGTFSAFRKYTRDDDLDRTAVLNVFFGAFATLTMRFSRNGMFRIMKWLHRSSKFYIKMEPTRLTYIERGVLFHCKNICNVFIYVIFYRMCRAHLLIISEMKWFIIH